jgi:hypothetical protein
MDTTTVETAVGRRVLDNLQRMNAERQAEAAARRDAIAELSQGWPGGKRPTAQQIRERWASIAAGARVPGLRSIRRHMAALRGDWPVERDTPPPQPAPTTDYATSPTYRCFYGPVKGPRDR